MCRRDNPTVSRRVLQLADSLGRSLEKQFASVEEVLRSDSGDVFTTKTLKNRKAAREARI